MNTKDIIKTPIGEFYINEINYWYDGLRVALLTNHHNEKYLGYLVDDFGDFDKWFLVPLSNEKLKKLLNGAITIKNAIKKPENGWLFEMLLPRTEEEGTCDQLLADDISDEDLPGENSYIF